jgi:hypothetical protein
MQVRSRDGRLSSRSLVLWLMVVAASAGCANSDSGGGTGEGGSSSASGGNVGTGGEVGTGAGGDVASDAAVGSGAGGAVGTGAGGASTGAGGASTGAGGGNGTGGALGAGGYSSGIGGSSARGGTTGSGGVSAASGGATGHGGTPGGAAGGGGASASGGSKGTGGTSASGGTTGSGAAGATGKGGASASGGAPGTGGVTGFGGTTAPSFCPANAIFCADFEEASGVPLSHPVGTAVFQDPTESGATFGGTDGVMLLDTKAPYDGAQSLEVTPSSAATARSLSVAVPSTFWVRLYLKSDQAIGQTNENAFFGAGTSPTYRTGNYVALAEQFGCLFLDKNATLYPVDQTCGNDWHCIMAEFDGATGNVQVFSGTTQIINATGWAPAKEAFNTFEFGAFADNPNGATVWYDDVAISSSPLSCP